MSVRLRMRSGGWKAVFKGDCLAAFTVSEAVVEVRHPPPGLMETFLSLVAVQARG